MLERDGINQRPGLFGITDVSGVERNTIGQVIRRRWDGEQGAWIVSLLCDGAPDRDRAVAP